MEGEGSHITTAEFELRVTLAHQKSISYVSEAHLVDSLD
jgi:hypothetical protein